MLKRFMSYYKPHKKLFFMDMIASFFVSIIAIFYPIITRKTMNDFIPNRNYEMIISFGILLLLLYLLECF